MPQVPHPAHRGDENGGVEFHGRAGHAISLLTRLCFSDRCGARRVEKEPLALRGYALTGSSPFGLAHVGLRIPVSQARFEPLGGSLLALFERVAFARFFPGGHGHVVVSGLPLFGRFQQHLRLLWLQIESRMTWRWDKPG